jgi:hypothetical protein
MAVRANQKAVQEPVNAVLERKPHVFESSRISLFLIYELGFEPKIISVCHYIIVNV